MSGWLFAAACVVLPGAWGIAMYLVFRAYDKRRRKSAGHSEPPPVDYSI
jgi:hypothetical protein